MSTVLFVPPELRRLIALCCDPPTLARLALTDRVWGMECEPVLYGRISLRAVVGETDAMLACLRLLHRTPQKAVHVRTLLLEFSADGLKQVMSAFGELWATLTAFINLVDLRIRLLDIAHSVSPLLERLLCTLSEDISFHLHTLDLPLDMWDYPVLSRAVLTAQAGTLRIFAMNATVPLELMPRINGTTALLLPHCACVQYCRTPHNTLALSISAPEVEKITTIAASLACSPANPSEMVVDSLGLILKKLPDAALAASLATQFPHTKFVYLHLPRDEATTLDPAAVAAAVGPLSHLFMVHILGGPSMPSITTRKRVKIARAVYESGCTELYQLTFPSGSRLRFHAHSDGSNPSAWYDPDTLSDGDDSPTHSH